MGRKLNALEEMQASHTSSDLRQSSCRIESRLQYLELIADQLGISVEQLRSDAVSSAVGEPEVHTAQRHEFNLAQQCVDLLKAFVEIQDRQDRLRCLQFVRDAAGARPPGAI